MEKPDLTGETTRELTEIIFSILPKILSEKQAKIWIKKEKRLEEILEENLGRVVVHN